MGPGKTVVMVVVLSIEVGPTWSVATVGRSTERHK